VRILWYGPIICDEYVTKLPAVSPAANIWQLSLLSALQSQGHTIDLITYIPMPSWPKSNILSYTSKALLPNHFNCYLISYLNLPSIRALTKAFSILTCLFRRFRQNSRYNLILSYNSTLPEGLSLLLASKFHNCPWISIVADGLPASGASAYVYLSWKSYINHAIPVPKLYLDGGVSWILNEPYSVDPCAYSDSPIFLYSGSLGIYGGVDFLIEAFACPDLCHSELWITGKDVTPSINARITSCPNIKYLGFLDRSSLHSVMKNVSFFVNPRPSTIEENQYNFPSKLFEYFRFLKPVISTVTPGMHPSYASVLLVPYGDTVEDLRDCLVRASNMSFNQIRDNCILMANFVQNRTWNAQAHKLLTWASTL
jgi:glycosyltransferase involved in cell wall biosynthesis